MRFKCPSTESTSYYITAGMRSLIYDLSSIISTLAGIQRTTLGMPKDWSVVSVIFFTGKATSPSFTESSSFGEALEKIHLEAPQWHAPSIFLESLYLHQPCARAT